MTPRLALTLAGVAILLLAGAWLSRGVWKPALDRAVAAAWRADDNAGARQIEVEGSHDTAADVAELRRRLRAVEADVGAINQEAREAPDANEPLDPDRADRLRRADRVLCAHAPALDGCAAAQAADAGRSG